VTELLDRLRAIYDRPFWRSMGIGLAEAESGRAVVCVEIGENHLNTQNAVHGGVIASLIDTAAGCAVRTLRSDGEMAERPHATSDLHVSYLAAARGRELFAEGRVTRMGRTLIFIEVSVRDETERLVARGLVTFAITSRPTRLPEETEQTGE